MRRARWVGTRWLGLGLTAGLSVVTLGLAATERLGLYINPESSWFAVGMAVVALVGVVLSFAVPLGAEAEHGHDHVTADAAPGAQDDPAPGRTGGGRAHDHGPHRVAHPALSLAITGTGGVLATAVVAATLVLPPAALSVDLAIARDVGSPPLFGGTDAVALATTGDTATFGIGEWATVFATSTSPDTYDGEPVSLIGFVTADPDDPESLRLTRLVITHCVIDAQTAVVPVSSPGWSGEVAVGDWVQVEGTVRTDAGGALMIEPAAVTAVSQPDDPYEY